MLTTGSIMQTSSLGNIQHATEFVLLICKYDLNKLLLFMTQKSSH